MAVILVQATFELLVSSMTDITGISVLLQNCKMPASNHCNYHLYKPILMSRLPKWVPYDYVKMTLSHVPFHDLIPLYAFHIQMERTSGNIRQLLSFFIPSL